MPARVEPLDVRDLAEELGADVDVVLPRRPQRGDLVAGGRQAGLREQVGAVTHGEAADVGRQPDERATVR
jgi:hypothetical protein